MIPLKGDRNQCQSCKEYFNSTGAFEGHRTGKHGVDRRCRTVDEMIERGYSKNKLGFWIASKMPESLLEKITGEKHADTTVTSEGKADLQQSFSA
jgi:hypothetical protein